MKHVQLVDLITDELARLIGTSIDMVSATLAQDSGGILLRRAKAGYDKMTPEEIEGVALALGHQDEEAEPCDACKMIARQEYNRSQEEA